MPFHIQTYHNREEALQGVDVCLVAGWPSLVDLQAMSAREVGCPRGRTGDKAIVGCPLWGVLGHGVTGHSVWQAVE